MNRKFYVCSKFSEVVFTLRYVRYGMLHYGSTHTASTIRYDTLQFFYVRV